MKFRFDQITGAIREEVATILLFKANNPYFKNLAITRVKMTKDLKQARIYYDFLGSTEEKKKVQHSLDKSVGFIRKELAPKLHSKSVPQLAFFFDESQEAISRLDDLFQRVQQE